MFLDFSILKLLSKNIKFHVHNLKTNFNKILEVLKFVLLNELDFSGNYPKLVRKLNGQI